MAGVVLAISELRPLPHRLDKVIQIITPQPLLSMTMLGPLTACDADGHQVLPRVRKTRALLAILALAAPRPVSRVGIVALLWSRRDLPQARGSLRQATHELRMALGPVGLLLRAEAAHLALSDNGLQVDARQILLATPTHPDALGAVAGRDAGGPDRSRPGVRSMARGTASESAAAGSCDRGGGARRGGWA
jgi:hypothetical protein